MCWWEKRNDEALWTSVLEQPLRFHGPFNGESTPFERKGGAAVEDEVRP
jgi:hypothetical protein